MYDMVPAPHLSIEDVDESDDDLDDVREAEDANGQCLGPDDDVYQRVFPVDNPATTNFERIVRVQQLSDEYLRLEQAWNDTGNVEDRLRRDDVHEELTTLMNSMASAATSAANST